MVAVVFDVVTVVFDAVGAVVFHVEVVIVFDGVVGAALVVVISLACLTVV